MKKDYRMPKIKIMAMLMVLVSSLFFCGTGLAADNSVTVDIPVYKIITGDKPATNETFTFSLTAVNEAPMPSGSENGVSTVRISGAGNTTFGSIAYTAPGDYRYTINEVSGNSNGYKYDTTMYDVTVQVTWKDEPGGDLQSAMYIVKKGETEKQQSVTFTNTYTIVSPWNNTVIIDPPVSKVIKGDTPSEKSTFTFYLKADNTDYPMPVGSVDGIRDVNITGSGTVDFGNISYSEPGVYTYKVYEKDSRISGYTYDSTVYTMTVTVTGGNGGLSAERVIKSTNGVTSSSLIFTNIYDTPYGPKTGDDSIDYIWWILLGLAVIGIGAALYLWRRQER